MENYGSGVSFLESCSLQRDVLEAALERKARIYDDETGEWIELPCTKEKSVEIALSVFDDMVYKATELLCASKSIERLMESHGLEAGKDYTIEEYMNIRNAVMDELLPRPAITVVK